MAFSEVREYQYGDDIRDIDWNVTARYVRPYVKVFEEERELTVMLLIDVSGSRDFGSVNVMKKEDRHQNRCGNNAFFHFSMSLRTGGCAGEIPQWRCPDVPV